MVWRQVALPWREVDLSGLAGAGEAGALEEVLDGERAGEFDMARPPLLRFVLVRLAGDSHRLVITSHHILWDGWSMPVLAGELLGLYRAGGSEAGLAPVAPVRRYLDWLACWDRGAAEAAWADALAGMAGPTLIAPQATGAAAVIPCSVRRELPAGLTAALTALARRAGVTLNTLIQAGWALYLSRMTGQHDVIFGATVSGRPADIPDIERMVGLFINTIPVRVQIREDETLTGLLGRVQAEQAGLLPYHQLPLPQIQRLGGAGVLFDTLTVFENYPVAEMMAEDSQTVSGLRVAGAEGRDATHYPLALAVVPAQRLRIRLDYQPALFDQVAAEQVADRLVRVLEAAAADPGQLVSAIEVLGPGERRRVLAEWNDTARPVRAGTLPELFEAQVAAAPHAVAVVCGDAEVSYGELNGRANRLARLLIGRGVGPESIVALALPRTADAVVAVLAVVKAGGAYLPVDPQYPAQRIGYMLTDAAPVCVITTSEIGEILPGGRAGGGAG